MVTEQTATEPVTFTDILDVVGMPHLVKALGRRARMMGTRKRIPSSDWDAVRRVAQIRGVALPEGCFERAEIAYQDALKRAKDEPELPGLGKGASQ